VGRRSTNRNRRRKDNDVSDYTSILTERDGAVLTITMNRPDVLNAFDEAMPRELKQAFDAAADDPEVRCLILTGAGRGFNAGADLAGVLAMYDEPGGPHLGRLVRERYIPMVMAVRSIEKPVIAALNGVAAGAGSSLALACDLRIASERASFVQAFVRIGLIPDTGGTLLLPLLVGPARAAELAFGGGRVDAQRALEIGLVERVVPPDELMPAALAWAQELAALPTTAIGLTKRAFNRAFLSRFQEQLELEADLMQEAGQTLDHREGVTAFMEKRPPVYVGR